MNSLHDFYPLFWALLSVLASFTAILCQIYSNEYDLKIERKKFNLRDKAIRAVSENRGAV